LKPWALEKRFPKISLAMKKLFLLMLALIFFNCNKVEKHNVIDRDKEIKVSAKISEEYLENFDLFFKKFSKDSIYQKERIQFPLKCIIPDEDDMMGEKIKTKFINSSNFVYINFTLDSLAMKKETDKYTIEKKEKNEYMIYSRLGYDNGIFELYKFKRIKGDWYLIEIENLSS
jgi:hypothetical protein